ncbi:TetR/AcrR family transcriptional regulator [Pantoea sp. MBD-2R]|uniref:TetR/AcrR family transcriptional regulator n=1 Tax=unclassified Pantoea TaxID=2630326 RepID=UPI0011BE2F6B|nr:TetR/AcrR family transcriptional regulator [Pantoea sp. CCBC3-3-1]
MDDAVNKAVTRRGRPKASNETERRQRILAAAMQIFIETGFKAATTAGIAARAKVSKRTLYEAFTDKKALFAAVVHQHRHLILDLPRPGGEDLSVMATLYHIFRLDSNEELSRSRETLLNLIVRESVLMPELADYLYEHEIVRSRERLIEWLESENQRGRIAIEDLALYAGMLMDIVFGALLPRRKPQNATERSLGIEHIKQRLQIVMQGVLRSVNECPASTD